MRGPVSLSDTARATAVLKTFDFVGIAERLPEFLSSLGSAANGAPFAPQWLNSSDRSVLVLSESETFSLRGKYLAGSQALMETARLLAAHSNPTATEESPRLERSRLGYSLRTRLQQRSASDIGTLIGGRAETLGRLLRRGTHVALRRWVLSSQTSSGAETFATDLAR